MKNTVICTKCNGTGYIAGFAHVNNGVCFDCGGAGTRLLMPNTVGYARQFVNDRLVRGFFIIEDVLPEGTQALKCTASAEEWLYLAADGSYFIGQPVCKGGTYYHVQGQDWPEFTKHFNKLFKREL